MVQHVYERARRAQGLSDVLVATDDDRIRKAVESFGGNALMTSPRDASEANIFASVFDVVRPEARGTATGCMNTMGWLVGGGLSPIMVGFVAERQGLSVAIAATAVSWVLAGLLLFTGVLFFVQRDTARMAAEIAADVQSTA